MFGLSKMVSPFLFGQRFPLATRFFPVSASSWRILVDSIASRSLQKCALNQLPLLTTAELDTIVDRLIVLIFSKVSELAGLCLK